MNDVPALLQPTPLTPIEDLNLQHYEISPIEPLHDIKGHLSNLIEEAIAIARGEARTKLENIQSVILSKDTLRCSDYWKAVILMYKELEEIEPNSPLTEIFRTAVEINQCYTQHQRREPGNKSFAFTSHFYTVYCAEKYSAILRQ